MFNFLQIGILLYGRVQGPVDAQTYTLALHIFQSHRLLLALPLIRLIAAFIHSLMHSVIHSSLLLLSLVPFLPPHGVFSWTSSRHLDICYAQQVSSEIFVFVFYCSSWMFFVFETLPFRAALLSFEIPFFEVIWLLSMSWACCGTYL